MSPIAGKTAGPLQGNIDIRRANSFPEIAFRVAPNIALPDATMRIDYDLARLRNTRGVWRCCELSALTGPFDYALMEASSRDPYAQLRYDLAVAGRLIAADGEFRLLLRERKIAKRLTGFAEEAFTLVRVVTDKSVLQIICERPGDLQPVAPHGPPINVNDPATGRSFALTTWPGLFSGQTLDAGTAVLLDNLPSLDGRAVLDVGCGYGPISIVAAGRGAAITYADVDARAIRQTTENLTAAGFSGQPLLSCDLSEVSPHSIDVVISNPPTHAGSETLQTLLGGMAKTCRRGGQILIVVRRHLNYEKWMSAFEVEKIDDRNGYKVLKLTPRM